MNHSLLVPWGRHFANGGGLIHHLNLLRAEPFGRLEDEGVKARCHTEVQHMAMGHILEAPAV